MNKQRQLEDIVMMERWGYVTQTLFNEELDQQAVIAQQGIHIADAVVLGHLRARDARIEMNRYAALDRQAVIAADGDIENFRNTADYIEATARRVAHHAGITAVELVSTRQAHWLHEQGLRRRLAQQVFGNQHVNR